MVYCNLASASAVFSHILHSMIRRYVLLVLAALIGMPCVSRADDAPLAHIRMIGGTGMAPCAVHVDALDIRPAKGTPLTCRYQWDFGDAGSAYNMLEGWNAAHLYTKPGKYTIVLKLTDESGAVIEAKAAVDVRPDRRRAVYLSADGNDSNDGATPATPLRSAARAAAQIGGDTKLLFRRGDVFPVTSSIKITSQNVLLTSYGDKPADPSTAPTTNPSDDPRPRLIWTGPRNDGRIIIPDNTSSDVVIQDLAFDTIFTHDTETAGIANAVLPAGSLCTIDHCLFLNIGDAVNCERNPTGLLVQDNSAPLETGLRGYFVWVQGIDVAILGNDCANSTRQHDVRANLYGRLLVADNHFTNLNRQSVDKKDISKGCIVIQRGDFAYVTGNTVSNGPIGIGPLAGPDGAHDQATRNSRTRFVVVENNKVNNAPIVIDTGIMHAIVRNNLVHQQSGATIIVHGTDRSIPGRTVEDVRVLNNTGIIDGKTQAFLAAWSAPASLTLDNNLLVAPNLQTGGDQTAAVYVQAKDLSGFAEIANNIWCLAKTAPYAHGGINYVWPKWADPQGYLTPDQWAQLPQVKGDLFENVMLDGDGCPDPNSQAATHAKPVPGVWTDLSGAPRPAGSWAAGAMEPKPKSN